MNNFEDLQKEYTCDGEKSCLILTIPVEEQIKQYQIGMLEKNQLHLLLPLVVQRVNDEWKLSYDITSKIPLSRVLERKSLQHHEFEFIIRQVAALVHDLKEYLLDLSSVVFDKNYIYCDPADFTLFFAYLPVNTTEKEPERIKSFLRKLIVEDIRLVEDVSGSLLKKLLEALKSEAFTSELLYQCLESSGKTHSSQQTGGGTDAAIHRVSGNEKYFISGVQSVPAKATEASAKGKLDGNQNPTGKIGSPLLHLNTADHPPFIPEASKKPPVREQMKKGRSPGTGIGLSMQKYPKTSWIIALGVNFLLLGVLMAVIASSVRNPGNAVSNIAGFLLIEAAGNYFLITRLFSKDKIIVVSGEPDKTAGNTFKKRFANENADEDIILPQNPVVRFRGEMNREKVEIPSGFQVSVPTSSGRTARAVQDSSLNGAGNREEDGILNQNANEAGTDHGIYSVSGIQEELDQTYPHMQGNDLKAPEQEAAASLNIKPATAWKENMSKDSQKIIEPIRSQSYPEKRQSDSRPADEKQERNQSFPDKTMILGKPSQQFPCLVSHVRPYEKILLDKTPILIGRLADSVDYIIQNRAVGKIHAEIKKIGDQYFIIDLNSVNGTYVNGERLICNTETPITSGDKITLANETYTFTA